MSSSSLQEVKIAEQSAFGTVATSGARKFTFLNHSIQPLLESQPSASIRGDGNIAGSVQTRRAGQGPLGFEFAFEALEKTSGSGQFDLLAHILGASSSTYTSGTSNTSADGTLVSTATSGVWDITGTAILDGISEGDLIYIDDSAVSANIGKVVRLKTKTDNDGGQVHGANGILTSQASTGTLDISSMDYIEQGTNQEYCTIEIEATDITEQERFYDAVANTLDLNGAVGGFITGSIGFVIGTTDELTTSAALTSDQDAHANEFYNTTSHSHVVVGDQHVSSMTSFGLNINNNVETVQVFNNIGAHSIRRGTFTPSGQIQCIPDAVTRVMYNAAHDYDALPIYFVFSNSDGTYVIDFPRGHVTAPSNNNPGQNQTVPRQFSWTAEIDDTLSRSCRIWRKS